MKSFQGGLYAVRDGSAYTCLLQVIPDSGPGCAKRSLAASSKYTAKQFLAHFIVRNVNGLTRRSVAC